MHSPEELSLRSSLCFVHVLFCSFFAGSVTDKPPGPPNSGRKGELRSAGGCVSMYCMWVLLFVWKRQKESASSKCLLTLFFFFVFFPPISSVQSPCLFRAERYTTDVTLVTFRWFRCSLELTTTSQKGSGSYLCSMLCFICRKSLSVPTAITKTNVLGEKRKNLMPVAYQIIWFESNKTIGRPPCFSAHVPAHQRARSPSTHGT